MAKCESYHINAERHYLTDFEKGIKFAETGKFPEYEERNYGECWGTKECERCKCDGDRRKCDFYEKVREEAIAGGEAELEKLELEFYRQWILEHDLAFELIKDYEKWKQNRK